MLSAFVGFAAITGSAACGSMLCRKRFEECLLPVFAGYILIFYLEALLLGRLGMALIWTGWGVGLLSWIGCGALLLRKQERKQHLENLLTSGFWCWLIMVAVGSVLCAMLSVSQWDEFTHWALSVKNMIALDQLSAVPESTDMFKSYPPGLALLEYFFVRPAGGFHEGLLYFAYDMLLAAAMLPLMRHAKGKGIIPAFALVVLFPMLQNENAGSAWLSLYADFVLAAVTFYMLDAWCNRSPHEGSRASVAALTVGSVLMPLIKSTGDGLTILVLIMALGYTVLLEKGPVRRRKMGGLLIALAAFAVVRFSWRLYYPTLGVDNNWNYEQQDFVSRGILLLTGQEEPWRYDVLREFTRRLFTRSNFHNALLPLNPVLCLLLWLGAAAMSGKLDKKWREHLSVWGILSLGFVLYLVSLLMLYLYSFDSGEALECASMERYCWNYAGGATAFMVVRVLRSLGENARDFSPRIVVLVPYACAVVVALSVGFYRSYPGLLPRETASVAERLPADMLQTDKVWIDTSALRENPAEQELMHYRIQYELAPIRVNYYLETEEHMTAENGFVWLYQDGEIRRLDP